MNKFLFFTSQSFRLSLIEAAAHDTLLNDFVFEVWLKVIRNEKCHRGHKLSSISIPINSDTSWTMTER